MRPPRLLIVLFCLIFFPILLTFFSALTSPDVATPNTLAGQTTGLRSLFSFNIPSSLFPPSAIISLTDDNSTFFLARPAAFGPLLPAKGLSGQLWVGSGFGEGGLAGVEGELGCSDIPGWGEGTNHKKQDKTSRSTEQSSSISGGSTVNDQLSNRPRSVSQADTIPQNDRDDPTTPPLTNDGTDDHLHHPLPEYGASHPGISQKYGDYVQSKPPAHADIQSLQETAEIQGKVVLLSRGGCGFLEKAKWAQRRGGVALIVGDDTRGGNLVTMYARGDTSNVTIPALFTSHTTAHLLSSLVPGHSSGTAGLGDVLKSSQAKLAGQADAKERVVSTTATTIPSPTASSHSTAKERPAPSSHSNGGVFRAIGAFLGLCDKNGGSRHLEDSRRPPSSGNIDWINLGSWEEKGASSSARKRSTDLNNRGWAKDDTSDSHKADMSPESFEDDDFVIGVQDWRDPDLMPPRSTVSPTAATSVTGKDTSKTASADKDAASSPNGLQGGSITPGSGEYQSIDKFSAGSHDTRLKGSEKESSGTHGKSGSSTKGWFSSHFGWGDDTHQDPQPSSSPSLQKSTATNQKMQNSPHTSSRLSAETSEHEGLWVTMTPTSMSTSPFFDTLLVLVVSPLLTLTVVYALLLLRSRIRRRRWRAPKSVIERLPVRTYHTITTTSSSSSNSTRPPSPGPLSPTSPLLGNESRPSASRSNRSRSQTFSGTMLDSSVAPKEEKCNMQNGSTLWRRKYTGRQVECVVCLEEYIDGLSRVMRLPCGHEFHVECITPWLTTRRRTCPICKGDVVRSLSHCQSSDSRGHREQSSDDIHSDQPISRGSASSAPVQIEGVNDNPSDTEQNAGLLGDHANSAPQSSWRNLATLSFSALSGDTIWHQARADRNR
ncbi:Zinc finger RING-type [Penicillium concentricum]|uniref:RING-type E3 ubiquitin transferase n=1 Tax=Penicillium concentricum TaxID=293559 RepID=A0A9W9STP1_9EURO|nr:Zinc finger RING-type [Penicillium concentricum]KAJ5384437.1 Zinc finger RING-type [Penicillium concentricum]